MYLVYNLRNMHRNEKETEARYTRPLVPVLRPDPHPAGISRSLAVSNRTVEIFVDGESKGKVQLTTNSAPSLELLPETEPDNRLARVLRDDYPL